VKTVFPKDGAAIRRFFEGTSLSLTQLGSIWRLGAAEKIDFSKERPSLLVLKVVHS
jgi:hypothetical protein